MRVLRLIALCIFLSLGLTITEAEGHHHNCLLLAKEIYDSAIKELSSQKEKQLLVITNITYTVRQRPECAVIVDELSRLTGVAHSKGNLIILQDSPNKPPFVYFFNAQRDKALYIELDKDVKSIKTKLPRQNISALLSKDEDFETFSKEKPFKGNEYRLLMITSLWGKGLMTNELINAVRLHNHYCPGVTSGYHIGNFILENLPLSEGQGYVFIASPMWCKDDALQVMLDTTPGKRSFYALPLKDKEKECLKEEAKKIAGIVFRYNRLKKEGDLTVLSYDWDEIRKDAGASESMKSLTNAVKLTHYMMSERDLYKKYVGIIKSVKLNANETPEDFIGIGINTFEKLGLFKEGCK